MAHESHYHIIVNGTKHDWHEKEITYQQVVNLAFPNDPASGYTVTYHKGHGDHEGFLGPNSKPLQVKEGMEFRVKHSTRS